MKQMSETKGYDGYMILPGDRVELHPGCDLWAKGARFGEVRAILPSGHVQVRVDAIGRTRLFHSTRIRRI